MSADRLDDLLAELPRHDASDDLIARTLARVREEQAAERQAERARTESFDAARARRIQWARWGGMAAGLLLALGAWWMLGGDATPEGALPASGMTIKGAGTSSQASIDLGLSLLRNDVPVALEAGSVARASDKVLLRYTTDREGFAYLFRRGADGAIEVFHGTATLPGTHHVRVGGQIVGYGLDGLDGEHLFGVAWSAEPWAPADDGAAQAPQGFAEGLGGTFPRSLRGNLQGIVVDAQRVRVQAR